MKITINNNATLYSNNCIAVLFAFLFGIYGAREESGKRRSGRKAHEIKSKTKQKRKEKEKEEAEKNRTQYNKFCVSAIDNVVYFVVRCVLFFNISIWWWSRVLPSGVGLCTFQWWCRWYLLFSFYTLFMCIFWADLFFVFLLLLILHFDIFRISTRSRTR